MYTRVLCVDFESYYDKEYSLSTMNTWQYVFDKRFDAYLVAVHGEDFHWVGHPSKFDWSLIKGALLVMHNASFDGLVLKRLRQDGIIPADCVEAELFCTADMAAYLSAPRNLKGAARELLGVEMDKSQRDKMKGRTYQDAVSAGDEEALTNYGGTDAELTYKLWEKYHDRWPEIEQEYSRGLREDHVRGIHADKKMVADDIKTLEAQLSDMEDSIPWKDEKKLLSYPAFRMQCRKEGLNCPASVAKTSVEGNAFMDMHAAKYPWMKAFRDMRSINGHLKKFQTVHDAIRDDGTMYLQIKYFGTHTGRTAAGSNEDEQKDEKFNPLNMPRKAMFGCDLRHKFRAPKGFVFGVIDYCVGPKTKILKHDLSWVDAGEIRPGDQLVGFDEFVPTTGDKYRKYKPATVTKIKTVTKDSVVVKTPYSSTVCSADHMWLAKLPRRKAGWVRADELTPQHTICAFSKGTWEPDNSPDSQWLAGLADGEGSLTSTRVRTRAGSERVNNSALAIAQKAGVVLDKAERVLQALGLTYHKAGHKSGVFRLGIGAHDSRKFIGSTRPVRFMEKVTRMWSGMCIWSNASPVIPVLGVFPVGTQELCAIETDTHTFVADGLLSHNCQIEAIMLAWRVGDFELLEKVKAEGNLYQAYARKVGWFNGVNLKKEDDFLYQRSKVTVLQAGYAAGPPKFRLVAKVVYGLDLTEKESEDLIYGYRADNPKVVKHWADHQQAAMMSCNHGDKTHEVALRSGRDQVYFDPQWVVVPGRRGKPERQMAMRPWMGGQLKKVYGGLLTENEIQATARDVLRDARVACRKAGHQTVFDVYDEIVFLFPESEAEDRLADASRIMVSSSPWAEGCPLGVDAHLTPYYRKF